MWVDQPYRDDHPIPLHTIGTVTRNHGWTHGMTTRFLSGPIGISTRSGTCTIGRFTQFLRATIGTTTRFGRKITGRPPDLAVNYRDDHPISENLHVQDRK